VAAANGVEVMQNQLTRYFVAALAIALAGCSGKSTPGETRLTYASASPEDACRRVLAALAAEDAATLDSLRLTRFEHDSILVPQLPIAQNPETTDLMFAGYLHQQNNVKGVRRALADYGGLQLHLVEVKFTEPENRYGTLIVHRGTRVLVSDPSGTEFELPIFGSMLEDNGNYKLVSIQD